MQHQVLANAASKPASTGNPLRAHSAEMLQCPTGEVTMATQPLLPFPGEQCLSLEMAETCFLRCRAVSDGKKTLQNPQILVTQPLHLQGAGAFWFDTTPRVVQPQDVPYKVKMPLTLQDMIPSAWDTRTPAELILVCMVSAPTTFTLVWETSHNYPSPRTCKVSAEVAAKGVTQWITLLLEPELLWVGESLCLKLDTILPTSLSVLGWRIRWKCNCLGDRK